MKITKQDNFVWKIVTNKAKEIFSSGLFDLYTLHEDDSESIIDTMEELNKTLEKGLDVGIEVGFIEVDLNNKYNSTTLEKNIAIADKNLYLAKQQEKSNSLVLDKLYIFITI